ncbi:UvrD-helicase domain-containing protein [Erysipelothrix rhusiopathiae]|nr:UvrD-helicase domain-containing protein [Erysipelothrix rhusiopathiae]MDE8092793.1 UvrD-helicase domain-containing protein [Erysipelothrix rhusiopathiae]MDE8096962.1 UvrD-helicase domain-containing protein [Erysipelothrix rhusiopathiae]MDE8106201.1 UvrD-helicase domain-containing protein [Erysipelothrix rhusiopathiae]MDE8107889.1 UvrD-helicase domain-containing protein [Erysipelothrix rhusiopathiae]
MDYIQGLNKEQKEAVLTKAKHVRVIAGAGSGKTRVLTTRIVHLIADLGYYPSKICAITFTNKAANEMKERMEAMLPDAIRVHTSTIHSLCVRIIREEYEALNLVRNFTILDTSDQQAVMREAYKQFDYDRKDISFREALTYISNNKFARVDVAQAERMAGSNYHEQKKVNLYRFYVNRLHELFALDFDDLLLEVNRLFKENLEVRDKWRRRFDVVLVDEFQDVDHVQYGIVDALVGDENQLYVVGDPDQTIYTWRGANVDFIIDFDKKYPESETITLNQNYRSTQHILDSANTLIKNNKERPDKALYANKESEFPVQYATLDDGDAEAYWVANRMLELHDEGHSYLDMAVLYRSNYLSRALEKVLMARRIPYVIYGGLRFYDQAEIKDMMSYLRMITHGDDLALRRSIAMPRRGIGEKTLDTIMLQAREREMTMYESMLYDVHHQQATPKIRNYVMMIEDFREMAQEASIETIMQYVLKRSGLREHFEKIQELERVESLKELIGDALTFQENYENPSLDEYIQMVSLYGDKSEVVEGEYVRLMTVHAAKGLEFENVFIMGLADNIFPNKNSIQEGSGGIQEERRLMYVAITRAKERLFLSNNIGYNFVAGGYARASRFIKEMHLDEKTSEMEATPTISRSEVQDAISSFEKASGLSKLKKKIKFKSGDQVVHDDFGEGIVIRVDDDTIKIAFNFPHGTKVISRKYAGIRLKGDMS